MYGVYLFMISIFLNQYLTVMVYVGGPTQNMSNFLIPYYPTNFPQPSEINTNIISWKFQQKQSSVTMPFWRSKSEKLYMGYTAGIVVGKSVGKYVGEYI